MNVKGTLIPVGGNEDKGLEKEESRTLEYIHESILSRILEESGGPDASIVLITSASSIPDKVRKIYTEAFNRLGADKLHFIDIRDQKDAEKPESLELLDKSNCVMFTGGDQSNIVKNVGATAMDALIKRKYENEDFVVAGTSAGAMCMGENMITGGGKNGILTKGTVKMGYGLGLISDVIIDSHFIRRRRFGRLVEAVAKYPRNIGIGLEEDTGLVIKNRFYSEVIGSGMMIFFDPRELTFNDEDQVEYGDPLTITNLKTHIFASGTHLHFEENQIIVSSKAHEVKNKS